MVKQFCVNTRVPRKRRVDPQHHQCAIGCLKYARSNAKAFGSDTTKFWVTLQLQI